jgi:hypothetical protein
MAKLEITPEVRQLVSLAAPTAVRSAQDNPVVALLQALVDRVNALEAAAVPPTTTAAPTTTTP